SALHTQGRWRAFRSNKKLFGEQSSLSLTSPNQVNLDSRQLVNMQHRSLCGCVIGHGGEEMKFFALILRGAGYLWGFLVVCFFVGGAIYTGYQKGIWEGWRFWTGMTLSLWSIVLFSPSLLLIIFSSWIDEKHSGVMGSVEIEPNLGKRSESLNTAYREPTFLDTFSEDELPKS
ncbi:MAG: hypothetical protein KF899_04530, partial [Parvibaculum sp.]|nr:hypothetical protein [Parvibaculum sp.]